MRLVFTEPEVGVKMTPLPSALSIHVAPDSEYIQPSKILTIGKPTRVTTGAVVS